MLRLAPEIDRVATESDRKDVRFFKELMEKHATSANTALGVFNTFTTKSVQTDLGHILDDPRLHPRNKVFQLEKFFKDITPPTVAIAEQIKVEVSNIPLAITYEDALRVANQIRDLQSELELINRRPLLPCPKWCPSLFQSSEILSFKCFVFKSQNGKTGG